MHLKREIHIPDFFAAVSKCEGEVYFKTPDGDTLALRSVFCQYIFCSLLQTSDNFYASVLVLENPENDKEKLLPFIDE